MAQASLYIKIPNWVKKEDNYLENIETKKKIFLSPDLIDLLNEGFKTNFLESPKSEYEVVVRIFVLELLSINFLVFHKGIITEEFLRHLLQ